MPFMRVKFRLGGNGAVNVDNILWIGERSDRIVIQLSDKSMIEVIDTFDKVLAKVLAAEKGRDKK